MSGDFEFYLQQYADVLVRVGVNVQPGQRLVINAAVTDDPAVRRLVHYTVASAYDAGARYVDVMWNDQYLQKIRLEHAPADSFHELPKWRTDAMREVVQDGGSRLYITATDPDLLNGQNPDHLAAMRRVASEYGRSVNLISDQGYGTWSIGAAAASFWADKVLPDVPEDERVDLLWEMIFAVCRIDTQDPVAAWRAHGRNLIQRGQYLTDKHYAVLHYRAPGTDLTVGLADNHIWVGGGDSTNQDVYYMPNIPTEEVFTAPHRDRVNGTVTASKPLNYAGTLIDNFSLTFEDGRVVALRAKQGEDSLQKLVDMDEGAARLGEVALVPHSSPISQTGRLFYNTLYDENAANHIALGYAFRTNLQNGAQMSDEELAAAGGNISLTHVDFMIGSAAMDVDGIRADGTREAIMRQGEWVFKV